jgi:hypothetical protein
MRILAWMTMTLVFAGCSSNDAGAADTDAGVQGNDVTAFCTELMQSGCSALVRCKAVGPGGGATTAAFCQQVLPSATQGCVAQDSLKWSNPTQQDVDTCAAAQTNWPCTDLCNQVPVYPVPCQSLLRATNDRVVCVP